MSLSTTALKTYELSAALLAANGFAGDGRELVAIFGAGVEVDNLDAVACWLDNRAYSQALPLERVLGAFRRHLQRCLSLTKASRLGLIEAQPWHRPRPLNYLEMDYLAESLVFILQRTLTAPLTLATLQQLTGYRETTLEACVYGWLTDIDVTYCYFPSELTPLLANRLHIALRGNDLEGAEKSVSAVDTSVAV